MKQILAALETLVRPRILLIDLGSQYTKVIARILRELGYRVALLSPKDASKWILAGNPVDAIVLSGGDKSVYDAKSPKVPWEVYHTKTESGKRVPILAICYGMHSVAEHFLKGSVSSVQQLREYGSASIKVIARSVIFNGLPKFQKVWASHGDTVLKKPIGFRITARSKKTNGIAAMEDTKRRIYCLQPHPEVHDTPFGRNMIRNFVEKIARCRKDWVPSNMIEDIQNLLLKALGEDGKAVIGFSGGVDSTTLSCLAGKVLGKRLLGIVINGGQLREGELEEIRYNAKKAGVKIRVINAQTRFLKAMRGIVDAEKRREAFKNIYKSILMREARRFGAKFVIQGTLATDLIESGATGGDLIKSHHNVGLIMRGFVQLHPFADLFKYEVRELAKQLKLPRSIWSRQPSPGPGLYIRDLGRVTKKRLDIIRWADARYTEILKRRRLYHKCSQTLVGLSGDKVVGIKGDGRVYAPYIIVRAVNTLDFMTAEGVKFSRQVLEELESVMTQHKQIVGVMADSNNKPSRTTELM